MPGSFLAAQVDRGIQETLHVNAEIHTISTPFAGQESGWTVDQCTPCPWNPGVQHWRHAQGGLQKENNEAVRFPPPVMDFSEFLIMNHSLREMFLQSSLECIWSGTEIAL